MEHPEMATEGTVPSLTFIKYTSIEFLLIFSVLLPRERRDARSASAVGLLLS